MTLCFVAVSTSSVTIKPSAVVSRSSLFTRESSNFAEARLDIKTHGKYLFISSPGFLKILNLPWCPTNSTNDLVFFIIVSAMSNNKTWGIFTYHL